jgi:hypothetical protein
MSAGSGAALLTTPATGLSVGTVVITRPIALRLGSPIWLNLQVALSTVGTKTTCFTGATTVGAATPAIL